MRKGARLCKSIPHISGDDGVGGGEAVVAKKIRVRSQQSLIYFITGEPDPRVKWWKRKQ